MRHSLICAVAGVGVVMLAGFAGRPVQAETPPGASTPNGSNMTVTVRPAPPPQPTPFLAPSPFLDTQRESAAVNEMAAKSQQGTAAVHQGEDALGTGTSITH